MAVHLTTPRARARRHAGIARRAARAAESPRDGRVAYDASTSADHQEAAAMEGEEFLRRMRAGDPGVWDALLPSLRVIALGACRDLRVFDSLRDDIVQDVAFKVLTDWQGYRGDSRLGTWIYAIARNRCLDELRRRAVRGDDRLPADDAADGAAGEADHTAYHPRPEHALCVQQVLDALAAHPEPRPGGKRMIDVLLWWVENSPTTEELAHFLGTAPGAAKERKSYILRHVRALCRRFCGDEECALA
jgi:RNA polymerase sigma-70 factor (ECF subfamily)